jgi:hypothetical protein
VTLDPLNPSTHANGNFAHSDSGFNSFGLAVTRSVSATARSTIDTCRTLFIWIVSLGLGWETFKWLQVLGFALLVYFTFLYNGVVKPPIAALRIPDDEEVEDLLPDVPGPPPVLIRGASVTG